MRIHWWMRDNCRLTTWVYHCIKLGCPLHEAVSARIPPLVLQLGAIFLGSTALVYDAWMLTRKLRELLMSLAQKKVPDRNSFRPIASYFELLRNLGLFSSENFRLNPKKVFNHSQSVPPI